MTSGGENRRLGQSSTHGRWPPTSEDVARHATAKGGVSSHDADPARPSFVLPSILAVPADNRGGGLIAGPSQYHAIAGARQPGISLCSIFCRGASTLVQHE